MPTAISQLLSLADPAASETNGGAREPAWPEPEEVRSSSVRTLIRVFCLTAIVAAACEVVERVAFLRVSLWQAQLAGVVALALTSSIGVWLSLRRQFGALQRAGLHAVEHRRADAERIGLASALDQAAEAVVMTDPGGRIQYVNAAFGRMTGYSGAEAIGQNPRLLKSGDQDPQFYQELWQTIRAGKTWRGELINRRKDGSLYTEEMNITPVRDAGGAITGYIAIKQDITQRKAVEEARDFLASIVEASGDAVVGRDLNGVIMSWNRGAEAIYGYRAEEIVGKTVAVLVPPEKHGHVREVAERVRRGEDIRSFESVGLRKDGTCIAVFITAFPIRNSAGRVVAGASIMRDITERKRAEEERSLLASIVESSDVAIVTRSLDRTITSWNKGAESLYGYTAAEILGKDVNILWPGPASELEDPLKTMAQVTHLETVRRRKDGADVAVSLTICPIRNAAEEIVGAAGIGRDIRERKRAELALRESEEKYRSLVANIPDVIWTADAEGRTVFVSRNCQRMYGYTPEEICQSGVWFDRIHPDDRCRVKQAYEALFTEGRAYDVELRMQRNDGRWIWVHDRATSSYERDGKHYTDGIISDITERKQAFELVERLQRRNELILDSAGEGILGLDSDGRVTFANSAAAHMLDLAPAELAGKSIHDLVNHTRPDGTACSPEGCAIHASIRNGMERHATNDMFRRGDGRTFPVEFTRTPKIEDGIPVGAVVVFRDITEAKLAQERTQASLKEKEALLREIHHRVKNNLQVVCSLLSLQSRSLKDVEAKRVFEGTRRRVKAMALVHETLYQSGDLAGIDFSAYVSRLVPQLMHAYGLTPERVRVHLEVQSVVLPIDTAIPCALMLTELVSNSLKHTMAATREGELRIAFRRLAEPSWLLEVENPAGVEAADSAPLQGASFGLQLVTLLTEQLNGTVQIERAPDFRVTVVFPATERPGEN